MKRILLKYLYNIGQQAGKNREENLLSLLEKNPNAVLLDCGCYDGELTLKIAQKIGTKNIHGVDIDPEMIQISRKKGIKVTRKDLNGQMPFKDETFDVVTAFQVIEHLYNTDMFVSELRRITKENGYILISTENLASWHNIFSLILGYQPPTGPHISSYHPVFFSPLKGEHERRSQIKKGWFIRGHINVLTRDAFGKIFDAYGFRIDEERLSGFYPFPSPLSDILCKIDKGHVLTILAKMRKK